VLLDPLAEEVGKHFDAFDLICHVAFDQPPLTRRERADNVKKRNYFSKYGEQAKVLETLLEKYADTGIEYRRHQDPHARSLQKHGHRQRTGIGVRRQARLYYRLHELEKATLRVTARFPTYPSPQSKAVYFMSISSTIKSIQDIMRKDVGVDGDAQRLSQLVWMLFLKIFDDRESEWELLQDNYKSPLPEKYRWRNWAADAEGMTGEALKQFLDNDMFPALNSWKQKVATSAPT
jgi:type I site-specific restriction endonuclease